MVLIYAVLARWHVEPYCQWKYHLHVHPEDNCLYSRQITCTFFLAKKMQNNRNQFTDKDRLADLVFVWLYIPEPKVNNNLAMLKSWPVSQAMSGQFSSSLWSE